MSQPQESLLAAARNAVDLALKAGADEAEVYATDIRHASVDLQKDDVHNASTAEECTFGIRVFVDHAQGFATVNHPDHIETACQEAVAIARVSPPDPQNGLGDAREVEALGESPDPGIVALEIGDLVDHAASLVDRVKARDARVVIDSGSVSSDVWSRALASSRGVALSERQAIAGGYLFGMAVDGSEVGSFDHDGHSTRQAAELEAQLDAAADRFVIKTAGALGAQKGESFKGSVILSPEVVHGFVLGNLLSVLSGKAVRTGKSPLAERVGEKVASELIDLVDDGRMAWGTASHAFDREGTPMRRQAVLEDGVLRGFFYDVYEARAAGEEPTGHARGGAASAPRIGPSNLIMRPGATPFDELCSRVEKAVLVSRFSGSSNPITGEFSGVVKGGFLLRHGERTPIKETLIAGNLYDLLRDVSGVSAEIRNLSGSALVPAIRVDDISITAG